MILIPPDELKYKLVFNKEEVTLRDNIKLNENEKKIFEIFKNEWKLAFEDRFK